MALRLATLLTILLLAIPSLGGEAKVAPNQHGKVVGRDDARAAAQEQAYQKSLEAGCQAAWGTDCTQHSLEENRKMQKRLMEIQREQGPFFPRGCERLLSLDGCGQPPTVVEM
jgi:hypothetical protein